MGFTKKSFAVELSKLEVFKKPKAGLEQYPTDSETTAVILWNAALKGDVVGKSIVDLGCGTGVLGLGCLLLGARSVVFVDVDKGALDVAKQNHETLNAEYEMGEAKFILSGVEDFEEIGRAHV